MHYNPYLYIVLLPLSLGILPGCGLFIAGGVATGAVAKPSVYEFLGRDTSHGSFTHLH
jgi:hypothetical protein